MLNASTVNMELRKTNLGMCNVCKKKLNQEMN